MEQSEGRFRLIENKPVAVLGLCLTGIVAAQTFWGAVHHSHLKSYWLVDMRGMLPVSAAAAVNVGFYAYFLWLGVSFYRMTRGKERVLVAGWFVALFLGWTQNLVSMSAAIAIGWVKAGSMLIAILAAIDILLRSFASHDT